MRLSTRSRILFLLFVVLGVYYPALFGGVNSVDDFNMISSLEDQLRTDWVGMFFPQGGFYYRPLLSVTFALDKHLWDLSESFMHLENILLHAGNTVLVYLLAKRVFTRTDEGKLELPLLSALLFALHPINTESVAWISGRTDPLASLFVLSSTIFLFKGLQENRYRHFLVSTILLLVGCMAKEIAVFFLPAACFIVLSHQADGDAASWFSRDKLKRLAILVGPFVVCGLAYLYIRFFSSNGDMPSVLQVLFGKNGNALNVVRIGFKVFGFYIKKLFLPLPLNFAIFKISNHYVWLGIVAFFAFIGIGRRKGTLPAFAVTVGILLFPAILVTLSRVAWTPLAERYLYLPSAFFGITLVGSVQLAAERAGKLRWPRIAVALLLIPAAFFTAQRNLTWQTNLALYQDTLKKSPDSAVIKNELGIALSGEGRVAEAAQVLESAKKQYPNKKYALPFVNQANLKANAGDLDGARALILQVLQDEASSDPAALRTLAAIDEKRLFKPWPAKERREIYREIADTHDILYRKTGNCIDLYRSAQMRLYLGEKERAAELFEKAYQTAPEGMYFKPAAKKLAEKLKR